MESKDGRSHDPSELVRNTFPMKPEEDEGNNKGESSDSVTDSRKEESVEVSSKEESGKYSDTETEQIQHDNLTKEICHKLNQMPEKDEVNRCGDPPPGVTGTFDTQPKSTNDEFSVVRHPELEASLKQWIQQVKRSLGPVIKYERVAALSRRFPGLGRTEEVKYPGKKGFLVVGVDTSGSLDPYAVNHLLSAIFEELYNSKRSNYLKRVAFFNISSEYIDKYTLDYVTLYDTETQYYALHNILNNIVGSGRNNTGVSDISPLWKILNNVFDPDSPVSRETGDRVRSACGKFFIPQEIGLFAGMVLISDLDIRGFESVSDYLYFNNSLKHSRERIYHRRGVPLLIICPPTIEKAGNREKEEEAMESYVD